ncbi:response regulator [Microlunatus parietis]|uniref:DNA-binding NarL/FixJ family response regulator n=1 Tax=Microlunatus parietis TaxID=682979 RepID=A0A7Y9I6Q3_9ACTN|nr:response regulator transcription factor [Microlunatus parietis]NYE70774.1 DNA-binding NarL/FixJ family response regulator [Microlunatus parietis]
MTRLTVIIVDDDPYVRDYLSDALGRVDGIDVVGVAADGAEAVDLAIRTGPDVVLMDIRMPGVDGIAATRELGALDPPPAVILMTALDTDEALLGGLAAGARGYTIKTAPVAAISEALRAAAAGTDVLSPEATRRLVALADGPKPAASPALGDLGDREREVLRLIGEGASNAAIARTLYLAESTVKGHVSRLMTKLDCQNRTQLAVLAQQLD